MLEAIHKESRKLVSAFKVRNDLEWQGKQKDKFISPSYEIGNWEEQNKKGINECEVTFIKRHKRKEGTEKEQIVSEHFRIITEGFVENPNNESEEHKLAKKHIYDNYENLIIYNFKDKKVLDFGEIEDIKIESGVGRKRADVLITFKEWHEILGQGVAFEIQISPQEEEETIVRSYDRATYGYSVCWLWSKDLRNFNNRVEVTPYKEAQNNYISSSIKNQDLELSNIAIKAKRFTDEQKEEIMNAVSINEKILQEQKLIYNECEEIVNENQKILDDLSNFKEYNFENQCKDILQEKVSEIASDLDCRVEEINKGLKDEIALKVKNKIDYLLGTRELKDFLKNLPEPIEEVIIKKSNEKCSVCFNNLGFIIQNGKSYCKECAYKLNK